MTAQALPKVSIIINCYNGERFLAETLASVSAQTFTDWEIIFWDNASTDKTPEIAQAFGKKLRYFRSSQTEPLGIARNRPLEKAQGEFLAFLDADDLWLPRKLELQLPLFERNGKVGLVFCDTIFFNETGDLRQIYKRHKPPRGNIFKPLLRDYFLSMETVMVRREALRSLGEAFDPRFSLAQDKELFLRLARHWDCDYVDAPLAKWRVHSSSDSHKRYEVVAAENAAILEKWRLKDPDFNHLFREELAAFHRKMVLQKALGEWKNGSGRAARQTLTAQMGLDPRAITAFALTFFPASNFHRAMDVYQRFRGILG